ncbi:adenylyltransferase/cytidyltransferase family protein [Actinoplanes auranticolor]|uniref:ethanolamine-phosphate cytidylyltransferase n=1 Tax=Actinoplanes auranticolor TaxID=47988 RepID=A0A919S4U0_9ACTN|nr:adenylyltransferase/cytidyltransferase family protein [Actinoplanes auranticolor]GIM63982.1 hypothetical protein Aau02nite_07590 [Actinoplanes auranticolor]
MTAAARVYVDMVGDLFHPGHVALLQAARQHGDHLIVGVLSDETVASYKRRPIMTLAERVAVIAACRYADEVLPAAPYRVTLDFLDEHDIALVVHGDDITPEAVAEVYGPVAAAGRLRLVRYTPGVSTTGLISRVRTRPS